MTLKKKKLDKEQTIYLFLSTTISFLPWKKTNKQTKTIVSVLTKHTTFFFFDIFNGLIVFINIFLILSYLIDNILINILEFKWVLKIK